ncbi:MAG: 3-isopropylmalate dehydratase small subunit [Vallitaleaceae bacterium]|nr:3-isopropylmalate dehydratase small subunit [Vallitaleaceae bacterium]
MEPFVKLTGLVAPMDRTNVDTDAIIPKQFLKRIERSGFGQYLFYEFRFDGEGNILPEFTLNQDRFKGASILIARANFGCGSSREHAPWALLDFGFKVIIAPSFADIFYNNCLNNGILPIKIDSTLVDELFVNTAAAEGYSLEVDLEALTVKDGKGLEFTFELNPFFRHKLLNGLDDIAQTLIHEEKISAYEKAHFIH